MSVCVYLYFVYMFVYVKTRTGTHTCTQKPLHPVTNSDAWGVGKGWKGKQTVKEKLRTACPVQKGPYTTPRNTQTQDM